MIKRTRQIVMMCVVYSTAVASVERPALANNGMVEDRALIPMRIELQLDCARCVVFENFTLKVRIVNPNDYRVTLRGFDFGYILPQIQVLGSDEEWHRLYFGPEVNAFHHVPVTIPGNGVLERHRFLYEDFRPVWPAEPGVYQLRACSLPSRGRIGDSDEQFRIDWDCSVVELVVVLQDVQDREAMDFLRNRLIERAEAVRKSGAGNISFFYIKLYQEFLERYPDVAYAPEIRWHFAKKLQRELGNNRIPEEDVPEMVDLFEECLTFCLDQGGAYADEFLKLDSYGGADGVIELALEHKRWKLLKRIVKELERKYPDDEEAILYRRVIVVAHTKSIKDARQIVKTLADRFPESKYVRSAARYVDRLEHQRAQAKQSDEQGTGEP